MIRLTEDLEQQFQDELKAFEEEKQMKYVTTIERIAEAHGKLEEKNAIALNLLQENIPIARTTGLTIAQLQALQSQMK
ncbi:MAG: hypothetical protein VKJ24_10270 [Synechococcales bacterium]|nr:hypothetical protein [Synechococcales bacterium]